MMIKITIKGPLGIVLGKEIIVDEKVDDVIGLISYLRKKYAEKIAEKGMSSILSDFFAQNILIVNNIDISALNGPKTKLKDGDHVVILNLVHGG